MVFSFLTFSYPQVSCKHINRCLLIPLRMNSAIFYDYICVYYLSLDYPKVPPLVHYISFVADKLNPNLYEDGKVCVSLLGTWSGKGTETWTPNSNMLQLLVSIQGLILVPEVRNRQV